MATLFCIHLGLGDLINYIPIIKLLSEKDRVILPCYEKYIPNAEQIIEGMNVELIKVPNDKSEVINEYIQVYHIQGIRIIGVGHYSGEDFDKSRYIIEGYEKLGFNYKICSKEFSLLQQSIKVKQIPVPEYSYSLICEEGSEGIMKINRDYVSKELIDLSPPKETLILSWADIIHNAKEIHCIDTSWLWLVNRLPTNGNLFYHKYARDYGYKHEEAFLKPWTILQ